jgi:hypothetical protein
MITIVNTLDKDKIKYNITDKRYLTVADSIVNQV